MIRSVKPSMKTDIPENIVYIHAPSTSTCYAFITDANSEASIKTGKEWASAPYFIKQNYTLTNEDLATLSSELPYNRQRFREEPIYEGWGSSGKGTYYIQEEVKNPKYIEPVIETVRNGNITDVKIIGLESRGNGGRAYKVIVNKKYICDFREDVLMETIEKFGIGKGGVLKGTYIWIKYSGNTKLILQESELHKQIIADNIDRAKKKK